MTVQRISAGVPTGGQFATSARTEASLTLAPEPVTGADARNDGAVVSAVLDETDGLISREKSDGTFTETMRHGDVADAVRQHVVNLSDDEFDTHMGAIAKAAEVVSIVERADCTDTDVYEDYGIEGGVLIEDFPAGPDWEPGDGYYDLEPYRAAVISHWDDQVRQAVESMVEADTAAEGRPFASV